MSSFDDAAKSFERDVSKIYSSLSGKYPHIRKNKPKLKRDDSGKKIFTSTFPEEINPEDFSTYENLVIQYSLLVRPEFCTDEYMAGYFGSGGFGISKNNEFIDGINDELRGRNQIIVVSRFFYDGSKLAYFDDPFGRRVLQCYEGKNIRRLSENVEESLSTKLRDETERLNNILKKDGLESYVDELLKLGNNYISLLKKENKKMYE